MGKLPEGKLQILRNEQRLKVLAAFEPIPGGKPWGVLLDVPESALTGPAETLKQELDSLNTSGTLLELGLGLAVAIAGLLLVWLMARESPGRSWAWPPCSRTSPVVKATSPVA